jgi:copper(I)-binding protein
MNMLCMTDWYLFWPIKMSYFFSLLLSLFMINPLLSCACCSHSDVKKSSKEKIYQSKNNNIEVHNPYFAIYKGATNGAAYCSIYNLNDSDDKLIKAYYFGNGIEIIELHTHIIDDKGVAHMREVKDMIIPKGEEDNLGSKILEPGHDHIMLMKVNPKIHEKKEISLILEFEKAGKVDVVFTKKEAKKPCCASK